MNEAARKAAPLDGLVADGFFDVADLLLNLSPELLGSALVLEIRIVGGLADLFP